MRRWIRWTLGAVLGLLVLLAVALAALWQWASSDDFRSRVQQAAGGALGVPVQLGRIDIAVWPAVAVAVHDVQVQTRPALKLERIEARPVWASLLAGRPELDALVVRKAQLPQQGLVALAAPAQKKDGARPSSAAAPMPRRIVLEQVTWVDEKGQALTVDAEIAFAGEPLPQSAWVDVTGGRFKGAKARLERQAQAWQLRAEIGGGTVSGPLWLEPQRRRGWSWPP
jgi:uncharacterized protein involved in outer membrane biogenesis